MDGRRLKAEFLVAAGAAPSSIRLRYSGARRVAVDAAGDLVIATARGEYREKAPYIYQEFGGARKTVQGSYRVSGSTARFEIGPYDRSRPLVIDPEISFSTYFGGSGFDGANAIAVDAAGNIYIAGWTESPDLPTAAPAQAANAGGADAFVAKLDPSGARLLYCTYLGGAAEDRALGIALDAAGDAYIAGWTNSANFPVTASLQTHSGGGRDAFAAKLDAAGSLVYSTYLGGNGQDSGTGIAVDASGNAYISGNTNSTNFPVYRAVQSSSRGRQDAFVAGLNSAGAALVFSTYLGGAVDESANAIAVDSAGDVYIAGDTNSSDFPMLNAFQSALGGNQDAFVAKLNPATASLAYSSYLGGTGGTAGLPESALGIDVDSSGRAFIAGVTSSPDFPVSHALQTALNGVVDAFAAQVAPEGSALAYSTYLGGSGAEIATAARADSAGRFCAAGYAASTDFPVSGPVQTANAGAYDAFVSCFAAGGASLTFSTYFGGEKSDAAYALALRGSLMYLAGETLSGSLPLRNPVQSTNGGGFGAMVAKIATASAPPSGSGFVPVTPCRVMDTRSGQGKTGAFGPPSLAAYTPRDVPILAAGCGIPSTAVAYALNFTVVPKGFLGYLITWPTGIQKPNVSTLNAYDGQVTANAAIVPAGTGGSISVQARDQTDLIIDINGYFGPPDPTPGYLFHPVTPCRVMDTRADQGKTGPFGAPALAAHTPRTVPILSGGCGIPSTAVAYSFNFTVVPRGFLGYLITWPAGIAMPNVSTLNAFDGQVTANAAIVPAGADGAISVQARDATELIIDINGYFGPPDATPGYEFHAVTPCRLVDTRADEGKTGPFGAPALARYTPREIPIIDGGCGIPHTAAAYSLNFTVVPSGFLGYLITWPAGIAMPIVSTLNAYDGQVTANAAIVPAGAGGAIAAQARDATGLIVDINGYFGP
jgi:hypothetical protein